MVKFDVDTLPTVPDDPPAAGPDRALDPPFAGVPVPAAAELLLAGVVVPAAAELLLEDALAIP
jgi:hypothetical protein